MSKQGRNIVHCTSLRLHAALRVDNRGYKMWKMVGHVLVAALFGSCAAGSAQLPPKIMADRYLVKVDQLINKKNFRKALELMDKIAELQQEHNFSVPDGFHFKYAEVAFSARSFKSAIDSVKKYLRIASINDEFYREALALLLQAEQKEAQRKLGEGMQAILRPLLPEMVEIPGGSYRMGCVSGRDCRDDEFPVHTVRVERFEMSKYEVTFEEYDRFMELTGRPLHWGGRRHRGRRPVINVTWKEAVAYTRWLSEQTGKRYRLPTEAEWEYAARAGTVTQYSWGNEIGRNRARCFGCSDLRYSWLPDPVGSFGANSWGLHDMHGNVWEWVQDCWNDSYLGAPRDGSAWESGDCSLRVWRGGSWVNDPWFLRSAFRHRGTTTLRDHRGGFRVARTVTP